MTKLKAGRDRVEGWQRGRAEEEEAGGEQGRMQYMAVVRQPLSHGAGGITEGTAWDPQWLESAPAG